jgi:TetR/AcrR family transcriptional regulator, transcriptional repressor of bet genes
MSRRPDLARRAELARAAYEVLRTRGVQTSMSELADAIGVKRPTLYFYFPDLGAVFESVLEQTYQAHAELVLARMAKATHPLDRLRAMVDGTVEFHRERPQLVAGLFQLWAMGGRDVASVLERGRRALLAARQALVADLQAGIARREVMPCEPERTVDLVLAVLDGVLVHQVLGISRMSQGEATSEASAPATADVIAELAARVIEPLRPKKRSKPARRSRQT